MMRFKAAGFVPGDSVRSKLLRKSILAFAAVLAAASSCFITAQETPEKGSVAFGIYGTGSIPLGTYSDYVRASFGGGALAEWTLPFALGSCMPALVLTADGSGILTRPDAASSGWSSCVLAGFDARCPIGSHGLFVVPVLEAGAIMQGYKKAAETDKIKSFYVDFAARASLALRWEITTAHGSALAPELGVDYTFVPPTRQDCQHILGARLGILWRPCLKRKAESPETVAEEPPVVEEAPPVEETPAVEQTPAPEPAPAPVEAPVIKKPQTEAEVKQVQQEVKELKNVVVQETAKEIKISMGDIGFNGNSPELLETEYLKLNKICELLSTYGGKLLITGHCARFGDTSNDVKFSTERAQTVADYIIARGIYKAEDVSVEGKGSSVPVATNDTREGRAKNRRVEITVLKN